MGDVWIAFAKKPDEQQKILITLYRTQMAGHVAIEIDDRIKRPRTNPAEIAYLQGVAARLTFLEVLCVIVPMTEWWSSQRNAREMRVYLEPTRGSKKITKVLGIVQRMVAHWGAPRKYPRVDAFLSTFDRYAALAGIILWAGADNARTNGKKVTSADEDIARAIVDEMQSISDALRDAFKTILKGSPGKRENRSALVFQISLNRQATLAITLCVSAVKADAARALFTVNCSRIA